MYAERKFTLPVLDSNTKLYMMHVPETEHHLIESEIRDMYMQELYSHIEKFSAKYSFVRCEEDGKWVMWENFEDLRFKATLRFETERISVVAETEGLGELNGDYAGWPTDCKCLWQNLVSGIWALPSSSAEFLTMENIEEAMRLSGYYPATELLNGWEVDTLLKVDSIRDILSCKEMEEVEEGVWMNKGSAELDWGVTVVRNNGNFHDKDNCYTIRAITCDKDALTKAQELINLLRQFDA